MNYSISPLGIDGIDHINVYSKGKTPLGRWLSHFTFAPFVHPRFGKFFSVGFWYWRLAENTPVRERLRTMSGYSAKKHGRLLVRADNPESESFREDLIDAEIAKLDAHEEWRTRFIESTLPLVHYYEYPGGRILGAGQWVIDELSRIRRECQ